MLFRSYGTQTAAIFLEMNHGGMLIDNNVLLGGGLQGQSEGNVFAHNLFLSGAKPSRFGDAHSLESAAGIDLKREDSRTGVLIRSTLPDSVSQLRCLVVDAGLVGVFHRVSQSIEDRDARPITVDEDTNGAERTTTVAGPLAEGVAGGNVIEWVLRRPGMQGTRSSGCKTAS